MLLNSTVFGKMLKLLLTQTYFVSFIISIYHFISISRNLRNANKETLCTNQKQLVLMELITITTSSIKLRNALLVVDFNLEIERDKSLLIIKSSFFSFFLHI